MAYNKEESEKKWQEKWKEAKVFEANPNQNKKFYVNFPYPYINAYPHIGHFYTIMRVEAMARYKRLKGFNVLFPQGWHATGSPIVNAAKRVKEKEPKQLKILKDMNITEIEKFEDPKYWIEFFAPEFKLDFQSMGLSIDWRREFFTTDLNPHYDKFIRWQFNKLKEKNYVVKGKFPVVWDPKDEMPVGDHDRIEGEGEVPQEFLLVKHKLDNNKFLVSATLRPDTILGITNLYVHPDIEYVEARKENETWILGEPAVKRLNEQGHNLKQENKIKGADLIGKYTEEIDGHKVIILPATFIDPEFGTGLVHSVPSDSADDLIALQDLQKNKALLEKYNLNQDVVKKIKPIEVLETPGYGGNPAQKFLDEYKVKNQNERNKLDKIRPELYKLSFYAATFNDKYSKGFSKNLEGVKVTEGKELVKKEIIKQGWAESYYELTGKVVSRSLTECIVKIVDDQWFLDYGNENWKKLAHDALDNCKLYPEKVRSQFNHVVDWLHAWACTRESGLGTRLPWDEKWLIESLSDSTIYLAYYTISHLITQIPATELDDDFFDRIFLNKNPPKTDLEKQMIEAFNYFYPVDFRNSGKDLIQNHLTFYLFIHTAIFPKKLWPKGIGANGWVTVDGQKMAKSLGNMIPLREMKKRFSADGTRITILSGGESMDDPNWDTEFAKSINIKLSQLHDFCMDNYNKGVDEIRHIDNWFESNLNKNIREAENLMEETLFRSAIQKIFFNIQNDIKWYFKRTNNNPNKNLINQAIESQLIMLSVFTPHLCEEIWEKLGKKPFISTESWPKYDESKIKEEYDDSEKIVETVTNDIKSIMKLAKVEKPKKITLFISKSWKYELFNILKDELKKTKNPKELIQVVMNNDNIKKFGKEAINIVQKLIKSGRVPNFISKNEELKLLNESKDFLYSTDVIEIIDSENSDNNKAKSALPGKPGVLVE